MAKKVVEIKETEYLFFHLNSLIVKKENNKIVLPLSDIDTILISNPYCTISVPLINAIVSNNINLIICNKDFEPNVQLLSISGYYSNKNFLSQINWTQEFKDKTWEKIIKLKTTNYVNLIYFFGLLNKEDVEKFNFYYKKITPGDKNSMEGHIAKLTFKNLYGSTFNRSDKENGINKFLNYGYTILMTYVSRNLVKKGYDNRIGVFHKSFNNHFALATDLMEPFRFLIDKLVYELLIIEKNYDFINFKKKVFLIFEEKILLNKSPISVNEYICKLIENFINKDFNFESLEIDWNKK
ncbi:type II CRISPR-associated endonuclease Cas1 [Mycoplasmopsis synoviae]|uniref:type II CRISPR-associated endonuclease Cas1 n=1 Tax=Mycoplasmopsis synoviae TaxID=2109 RepID=UPI001CE1BE29|nr:type II CRISPR-associated endonuclease Cas1 [Mycoplasmopsis synoviae]UBY00030.1 type II CRISPR-associated endonuclease Cas1 [Mycoplasmopsis synoviae]